MVSTRCPLDEINFDLSPKKPPNILYFFGGLNEHCCMLLSTLFHNHHTPTAYIFRCDGLCPEINKARCLMFFEDTPTQNSILPLRLELSVSRF